MKCWFTVQCATRGALAKVAWECAICKQIMLSKKTRNAMEKNARRKPAAARKRRRKT